MAALNVEAVIIKPIITYIVFMYIYIYIYMWYIMYSYIYSIRFSQPHCHHTTMILKQSCNMQHPSSYTYTQASHIRTYICTRGNNNYTITTRDIAGMLGERGLGLVVHITSGYVAKINIP